MTDKIDVFLTSLNKINEFEVKQSKGHDGGYHVRIIEFMGKEFEVVCLTVKGTFHQRGASHFRRLRMHLTENIQNEERKSEIIQTTLF